MSVNNFWLWIMIGVFIVSCKKEGLPALEEGNSPIYFVSGELDGQSYSRVAGDDGVKFSHGFGTHNGIKTYFGQFESNVNDEILRIEFLETERPWQAGGYQMFSGLEIPFIENKSQVFKFDFGGVGNQLNYLLVDNGTGTFEPKQELIFNEYGIYPIKVRFEDVQHYQVFDFEFNYGFHKNELNPTFNSEGSNNEILLVAQNDEYLHEWYVNGFFIGNGMMISDSLPDGINKVKHIVKDEYGNNASYSTLIRVKEGKHFWQMNLLPSAEPFVKNNFGKVIVSCYKNETWYTSKIENSNLANLFTIKDLKKRKNLNSSDTFVIFSGEFDGELFNQDSTASLSFKGFNGQFGVKY